MKVISTTGRGPHTLYTVQIGDQMRVIKKKDLPGDVFQQWRNEQARTCMNRRREADKQRVSEGGATAAPEPEARIPVAVALGSHQEAPRPLGDSQSSQRASTSKDAPVTSDAGKRAIDMITCKMCYSSEISKIIIPCGHVVCCGPCLTILMSQGNKCPFCQSEIEDHFGAILAE